MHLPVRFLLWPFSWVYGFLVRVRNILYDTGFCKVQEFDFPVISVGNLSVGGTGKTPLCLLLLARLSSARIPVAYISRGYGRQTRGLRQVTAASSPGEAGDEAVLVAQNCPEALVLVAENRREGLLRARSMLGPHLIAILDDAFQHRRVKASLKIVMLAERDLIWPRWLLPAGRLREPLSSLKRADAIIMTKPEKRSEARTGLPLTPTKDLFLGNVVISAFWSFPQNTVTPRPEGSRFFVFCGIGFPEHFLNGLQSFGTVAAKSIFADHHQYSLTDWREIVTDFHMLPYSDKALVTTEKDFVRLKVLPGFSEVLSGHTLWVARSVFAFENKESENSFFQLVYDTCGLKRICP